MDFEPYNKIKEMSKKYNATLIAVSKKQPIERIIQLYNKGQRHFGENIMQELLKKHKFFQDQNINDIQWHFIGHLQRNKVKLLLGAIPNIMIHSLDSLKLAQKIEETTTKPIQCFIQVNIDCEESKHGIMPEKTTEFYNEIQHFNKIKCIGLMCIPEKDNATSFKRMRELKDSINNSLKLSMGMSDDFQEALKNGATHIRIGTKIFGKRD